MKRHGLGHNRARVTCALARLIGRSLLLVLLASACSSGSDSDAGADSAHAEGEDAHAGEGEEHEDEAARVTLGEAAFATAAIQVDTVRADNGEGAGEELVVPGQVEADPRRVAIISPRIEGRLERVMAVVGDRVGSGETVALLYSREYLTAQNELLQAARRARALVGTQDAQGAEAIAEAARRRLRLLGVSSAEVARLESTGEPRSELAIVAPFAGSIMEASALSGEAVESGAPIFRLADLSFVDVVAAIPERAVPLVHHDQTALIGLAAFPQMQFAGSVERIRDELDPETRTVGAVIHAANPGGRLRPGMFATVRLNVRVTALTQQMGASAERTTPMLTVPETAIVTEGESRFAFVEVGPRTYERRTVDVVSLAPPGSTRPVANRVGIRSGLVAGDRVVVNGAFVLKSELAKAGLSHDH